MAEEGQTTEGGAPPTKKRKDSGQAPGGAYGIFCSKNKARFQELCKGLGAASVYMMAGKMWQGMNEAGRQPYRQEFERLRREKEELRLTRLLTNAKRQRWRGSKSGHHTVPEEEDDEDAGLAKKRSKADASAESRRVRPDHLRPLLAAGAEVLIDGLVSAPELNGLPAQIISYAAGRYVVAPVGTMENKRVRPCHVLPRLAVGVQALLLQLPLDSARSSASPPAPPVSSSSSSCPAASAAALGATVAAGSADGAEVLEVATKVVLQGLASAQELNGQRAEIMGYDPEAQRYVVALSDGEQRRVRPCHVAPVASAGPAAVSAAASVAASTRADSGAGDASFCTRRVLVKGFRPESRHYVVRGAAGGAEVAFAPPSHVAPLFKTEEGLLLQGLLKAPELNGQPVRVKRFDDAEGRYVIRVAGSGETRHVRPENVRPRLADGSPALLDGLQEAGELNGTEVKVDGFDDADRRYIVSLPPRAAASEAPAPVRPRRLWLATRVEVAICGRWRLPEIVGQLGHVEELDDELGMYVVRLQKGTRLELVEPKYLCQWFAPGTEVVLRGLPKLEGQLAQVEKFIALKGSYVVRTGKDSGTQLIKSDNLRQWFSKGTKVVVVGLPDCPSWDNHAAHVEGYDKKEGRYLVQGARKAKRNLLKPENLRVLLPVRTTVRLEGLQTALELNRREGRILRFDDVAGRYVVRMLDHELEQEEPIFVEARNVRRIEDDGEGEGDDGDADPCARVGASGSAARAGARTGGDDGAPREDGDGALSQPGTPGGHSRSASSDSHGFRRPKRPRRRRGGGAEGGGTEGGAEGGAGESPEKMPRWMLQRAAAKASKSGLRAADGQLHKTSPLQVFARTNVAAPQAAPASSE